MTKWSLLEKYESIQLKYESNPTFFNKYTKMVIQHIYLNLRNFLSVEIL